MGRGRQPALGFRPVVERRWSWRRRPAGAVVLLPTDSFVTDPPAGLGPQGRSSSVVESLAIAPAHNRPAPRGPRPRVPAPRTMAPSRSRQPTAPAVAG